MMLDEFRHKMSNAYLAEALQFISMQLSASFGDVLLAAIYKEAARRLRGIP